MPSEGSPRATSPSGARANKPILASITAAILSSLTWTAVYVAPTPVYAAEVALVAPVAPPEPTVDQLIEKYAKQYGVSAKSIKKTLFCESSLRPDAVGDNGNSHGIAQIYLKYHPDVSKAEALDPAFAIEWMARKFSEGKSGLWTCARKLKV